MDALTARGILPDEARGWALRGRRHAGPLVDCFRRLASTDGPPLRECREEMLALQVNPPNEVGTVRCRTGLGQR